MPLKGEACSYITAVKFQRMNGRSRLHSADVSHHSASFYLLTELGTLVSWDLQTFRWAKALEKWRVWCHMWLKKTSAWSSASHLRCSWTSSSSHSLKWCPVLVLVAFLWFMIFWFPNVHTACSSTKQIACFPSWLFSIFIKKRRVESVLTKTDTFEKSHPIITTSVSSITSAIRAYNYFYRALKSVIRTVQTLDISRLIEPLCDSEKFHI